MIDYLAKWVTPNQLTIARILMVPFIFIILLWWYQNQILIALATILFLLACFTDYLDGSMARKLNLTSELGKLLDPIADKILIAGCLVALVYNHGASPVATAIILAREFAMSALRDMALLRGVVIPASLSGKIKTITQMVALSFLIIHFDVAGIPFMAVGNFMLWIAAAASVYSAVEYTQQYFKKHRRMPPA